MFQGPSRLSGDGLTEPRMSAGETTRDPWLESHLLIIKGLEFVSFTPQLLRITAFCSGSEFAFLILNDPRQQLWQELNFFLMMCVPGIGETLKRALHSFEIIGRIWL